MHPSGFTSDLTNRFEQLMQQEQWLEDTWKQLTKDFGLCGIPLEYTSLPPTLEASINEVVTVVSEVRQNPSKWDALNYRIDLPVQLDMDVYSDLEVTQLYFLRSFQKVWLRKNYSEGPPKDDPQTQQKHLKP